MGKANEYAEPMRAGSWQPEYVPITVDPDAMVMGGKLHYDTMPLPNLLAGNRLTVSREELGLPPLDEEPDAYAAVNLGGGWLGLMNLRSNTIVTKIHGPGAPEDIEDRLRVKNAKWLAWKARQDD